MLHIEIQKIYFLSLFFGSKIKKLYFFAIFAIFSSLRTQKGHKNSKFKISCVMILNQPLIMVYEKF